MKRPAKVGVLLEPEGHQERKGSIESRLGSRVIRWLGKSGIPFDILVTAAELEAADLDVLILACDPVEITQTFDSLWHFAEQGGILVTYAGLNGFADRLGCNIAYSDCPGYALLPSLAEEPRPLRYARAVLWQCVRPPAPGIRGDVELKGVLRMHGPSGSPLGAALQQFAVGTGALHRWAVDFPSLYSPNGGESDLTYWEEAFTWHLREQTLSKEWEPAPQAQWKGSWPLLRSIPVQ